MNPALEKTKDKEARQADNSKQSVKPLGQRLLEAGLITESQLDLALREKKRQGKLLGDMLVELGFITPEVQTSSLAAESETEVVDVAKTSIDPDLLSLIPYSDAKKFKLIPLEMQQDMLVVALADAFNVVAIDQVERLSGKTVKVVSAPEQDILEAIERNYSHGQSINETIDVLLQRGVTPLEDDTDQASPMVRLVDQIIASGIKHGATDIHVEPDEKILRIRLRVDGVLQPDVLVPQSLGSALTARIKLMAGMNISEKRVPQDGRIQFGYGSGKVDLRVSTLPTNHGESIVMRILDNNSVSLSLDSMGFSSADKQTFMDLMAEPYGMVLVTGPTGSGKTTTLYTALSQIDKERRSVFTLEDPIEYSMPMVRQTPINAEIGMDFGAGLRALLRQDPDVILIGEIRDLETAQLATRTALTGHLLLSTLHTNTAAGVIPRLIDMGIESYLLPAALNAAIGQRLVRKLCPHCRQPAENTEKQIAFYKLEGLVPSSASFYEAQGCEACNHTGYKGRQAIYEILRVSEAMHDPILNNASVAELENIARGEGMKTMQEDGLIKASEGITSIDEVMRVVR